MTQPESPGQILALTDGSPAAAAAVGIAAEIARVLGRPLAILGISSGPPDEEAIGRAVQEAQMSVKPRVATVEAVLTTGELLSVAQRRVTETPTSLVVLGSSRRAEGRRLRPPPRVWSLVKTLPPPVLVTDAEKTELKKWLFCTGGAHYIDEGADLAARIAAGLAAAVTVFHVSPLVPPIYGDRLERKEESAEDFLRSNSRLARNIRRQAEIFHKAGVEADVRVRAGDVVYSIRREIDRGGYDLVIVGSSSARGPIRTYVLGNVTRDIVTTAACHFLVLRSPPPGFWAELWRILTEPAEEKSEGESGKEA